MSTVQEITTARQLLEAPGLGRCELVRGELIMMSPAGFEHGAIVVNISSPLDIFVKEHSLGVVTWAETGFYIEQDPDTVRAPNVGFVRADRVPKPPEKGFFRGPPDLAVEVGSPDDSKREVAEKVKAWLDAGTRMVWVADPGTRSVTVYLPHQDPVDLAETASVSGGEVVPGFSLAVAEVFA